MSETTQFLISHGSPIVFAAVLLEQMGLPLPALPWLLAAGALSATRQFNMGLGIVVAVAACLIADTFWFYLGRLRGNQVLGFLCRMSLEPDSCVRRTHNVFTRYGMPGVVVAKFLPGMSTITPPLAGMSGINASRFFLLDGLGSLLYGSVFLLLGYFFSHQITQIGLAIFHIGGSALSLLVAITGLYIAYKYWQRQRLLHELRMARITVEELRKKLDAGEKPVILDLRSRTELESNPSVISGAVHLDLDEFAKRHHEFPHDRDIILYCACPNEVTSARVALQFHRKGFTRVRPLLGGVDAWRQNNFPMEAWTANVTAAAGNPLAGREPVLVNTSRTRDSVSRENSAVITSNRETI
jgi:membrane protein DedA with SNARE-associated domain/rhodanese-related sulfurtransferase